MSLIVPVVSEEMFENAEGWTDEAVTSILMDTWSQEINHFYTRQILTWFTCLPNIIKKVME